MTNPNCEVCQGLGLIRLPLYRRAVMPSENMSDVISIDDASRQYPCPECSETVSQDNIAVLNVYSIVESRYENDPNYIRHVREGTAHRLVDELLKADFIRTERSPSVTNDHQFRVVASLGVVSQAQVATLEQRVAERQEELAYQLVLEAEQQSRNWRSFWGDAQVDKSKVMSYLREALNSALAKRREMKPI